MSILPSKKIVIIGATVLLALGGWFFASNGNNSEKNDIFPNEDSFASALFQEKQKDSDNDGLKDWEEALWKTEVDNPDTDGDGTLDGEEIKLGRNPAKAGPDDKMEDTKAVIRENVFGKENELTKTDILARDFFASFLALQQSGNLNEQTKKSLTQNFLASILQDRLDDKYKISDLNIININSKSALKKYGNDLGEIIKKYSEMPTGNELQIIKNALQNKNKTELQKLDPAIGVYEKMARDFLAVRTPASIKIHQLNLANSSYNLSRALASIKKTFDDPILGATGISQYQNAFLKFRESLRGIGNYFLKNNIAFNKYETGYIFMNK